MATLLEEYRRRPRSPVSGDLALGTLRSPASTMMNGLQVYYPLEEASGLRFDIITNGIGPAAQFTRANNESLSRADNAGLSGSDRDITFACWVYFDTLGTECNLIAKWGSAGTQREYRLIKNSSDQFRFVVTSDGATSVNCPTVGSQSIVPTTGQWYLMIAWHDSVANTINYTINDDNTNLKSASHSAGIFDGTAAFEIGRNGLSSGAHNGRIKAAAMWDRVLTAAERTALYNYSRGRSYASLTTTEKVSLVSWWELTELSGSRADSHGTNTLTDNNTVTQAQGIFGNTLADVNTVTSNTGKIGTAAQFTIANSEQLAGGDSTELRGGDTDWEWAGWVYFDAIATDQTIFSKDNGAASGREYRLDFLTATAKMTWTVYDGTNAIGTVTTTGTFSATTWYYVRVYHDSVNNLVGISINGAAADTAATTGAPSAGTAQSFRFGANGSGTPQFFGGRLDEWGKYARLRTAGEIAADYASGSGIAYPKGGASVL